MKRTLLWLMLLTLALAACGGPAASPTPLADVPSPTPRALRHIRLPMGFTPSVQYAPFYVAVDKGYFAAEGIELEFDYSFETDGVALVGSNTLPFAVVSGEQVLLARAQGLPVTYVMAWFQKFPVAVLAQADSGILTPADLRGKKIGTPLLNGANFVGLRALLANAGVQPEEVTIEAIGFNQIPALTARQVDAVVVYANNEPIRLTAQGEKFNVMPVGDYVSLAANGLLSNEDTIAKEPELVRGFVRALAHGINDTMAHPDEAYTISKKFVPELTADTVEKQVLAATIKMWRTDRVGYADLQAWENMQTTLLDAGLLAEKQDLSKAVTNDFIP